MSGQQFEFMETIRVKAAKDIAESEKRFGREALQLAKNHEERVSSSEYNQAEEFLVGLQGEAVNPETFALAHAYMSAGKADKTIPTRAQLEPVADAAEKAIEIIESAGMVANVDSYPYSGGSIKLAEIDPSERPAKFGLATNGYMYLQGGVGFDVFSLVGRDNLDLPVNEPRDIKSLIKQRKDEITGEISCEHEAIPLIAGRDTISEFVTRIGLDIPVASQLIMPDMHNSLVFNGLFGSMALQVATIDKDMARDIVAEVRDGKPSLITKIQKEYIRILDIEVGNLGRKEDVHAYDRIKSLKRLMPDEGGAEIFFTEEELAGVRHGLHATLERSIDRASALRKADMAEYLGDLL